MAKRQGKENGESKRKQAGRLGNGAWMDEACVERAPAAATAACGLDGWAGTIRIRTLIALLFTMTASRYPLNADTGRWYSNRNGGTGCGPTSTLLLLLCAAVLRSERETWGRSPCCPVGSKVNQLLCCAESRCHQPAIRFTTMTGGARTDKKEHSQLFPVPILTQTGPTPPLHGLPL
jgi:hypothetical protein